MIIPRMLIIIFSIVISVSCAVHISDTIDISEDRSGAVQNGDITHLPDEVIHVIASYLALPDIASMMTTCKEMRKSLTLGIVALSLQRAVIGEMWYNNDAMILERFLF